ncbi:hypothetical protein DFA_07143 [Cavenderia fasciculata]|uniref:PPIase cyclophilin-type domain-containing protein n=1 Tax=Cavenderia fasciculata TaxID=261658 RepID=F4PVL3_CACFS|nr:uncharacterized protein DFA_07143 [Cavenderia fasciculata]EGG20027.1 hypothetical protein DFA_07143 [Cavenderia fasciculata]|eukprot:XP_004367010.1 hypothetical protein DFA_07143 [Cavenderia fasciculata]
MSSEPTTHGKVILKTTLGDLEIELWTKEAPLTTRNFMQLCMEGYYDGSIFHRVIPKFIAQTGDPTNTGDGGESIYDGKPFKDEFHSRLRFSRRGIVGMASGKDPNSNQSQFFITLDAAEQLNRRHTVFGRVIGDSLFNILKANELEIGENDMPLDPPKIISSDVISNPFEDIEPRQKKVTTVKPSTLSSPIEKKKKPAAATTKNKGLLSFGEDDDDEDNDSGSVPVSKPKPAPKPKQQPKQSKEIEKDNSNNNDTSKEITKNSSSTTTTKTPINFQDIGTNNEQHNPKVFEDKMRESMLQKASQYKREREGAATASVQQADGTTGPQQQQSTDLPNATVAIKKAKPEKKVIGSLSFKPTRKGAESTVPRVSKKGGGEQAILDRLNKFKNVMKEKPKDEDGEWRDHKLEFKYDPSGQSHYILLVLSDDFEKAD